MDHIFSKEPARQACKCFKKSEISEEGDAPVLDIISLDAVITATVEFLKRSLLGKGRDYTEEKRRGKL